MGSDGLGDVCGDGGLVDGALDHGFVQVMAPHLASVEVNVFHSKSQGLK
jgi:hypothetical protein